MSSNVTDNNQVDGKSSVTAYAQTQGNKVLIVANGNSSPSDLSNPYMSVSVNVGESFVLTQGTEKWSSNTYFHIMDSTRSNVLQLVRFHTSCSAPIVPGDRFGYITLLSSEIEGSTCGETGDDCTYSVVYYPDVDFEGTDGFNVEFCYSESGNQVCEVVRINIEVKDSVCKSGCPEDFEPVVIPSTLDAVVSSDAHDENIAKGLPDGEFAKLEHDDEFIVLSLREYLQAGSELELVISSYGGKLASGTVQGSYDGTVFGPPMAISTSNEKPSTKTEKLKFPYDVQFIKIIRDNDFKDKLLIDGARFDGTDCRPAIPDTIKFHTCVDETKTWNLNDILPEGSTVKYYTVTKTAGPAYGTYSLENSYAFRGCDLDKPKSYSLRYTGGTCANSDTEQEEYFKCKDEASLDGFSTVYVIVNDEKDKNKRLTDNDQYFVGNVSLNSVFKIDASLNSQSSLPGKVYVWIMDPANNELLQKLEIKTDCKKPINLYDQFASMQVVRYEAKNGNGVISEITELFESEYTPNTGSSGDDQIVLEICETENEDICQTLVIDLEANTIAPVAQNDTADYQPLTSGTSVTEIDILANDSHSGGETLRVVTPFPVGPSIAGATVTYDTVLQRAIYMLNNPQDGDVDSFT